MVSSEPGVVDALCDRLREEWRGSPGDPIEQRREQPRTMLPIGRVVGPADIAALAAQCPCPPLSHRHGADPV